MGKWIGGLKWLAAAAVSVLLAVLLVKWNREGGASVEVGFDDRIELTSQEIRRMEQIGQWEFLSVRVEVVADTLREGIFSDDRLVAVYTGTPRIGIDMGRATGEWVSVRGDTAVLCLPAVRLLDENFIDEARTKVFYESGKWSNAARRDLYGRASAEVLRRSLTPANLRRAEANARVQFTAMFRALGFRTVEIRFAR